MWLLIALAVGVCGAQETVGVRPYEMDWAERYEDDHRQLVDFEDLSGWTVETKDAVATLERSRGEQLFGKYVGKLTYRGAGNQPQIDLIPPEPLQVDAFDAVTMWINGNNWAFAPDPKTPSVPVWVMFEDGAGAPFGVLIESVRWKDWFLCHERLTPEQIARVHDGARFVGIRIGGARNKSDRVIYLDSLCVFTEELPDLAFEPRPKRGVAMFPGQGTGTNSGPGTLPFPNREQTILPELADDEYEIKTAKTGDGYEFAYAGQNSRQAFVYRPKTGTLSDIVLTHSETGAIRPCVDGGVYLFTENGPKPPDRVEHLGTETGTDSGYTDPRHAEGFHRVTSRWRLHRGGRSAEVAYTFRLWGKSLVVDVIVPGGEIAEVRYGHAEGLVDPKLVALPFYTAARRGSRPAVVVSATENGPLFLMGNTDWYRSNASLPFAINEIKEGRATYNGGTRYVPLTDGVRNGVYERLFITASNRFEEVLPTIANPVSPWKHITGTHIWRAHGASNREADKAHWRECHRYGMTEVVVTDHETGWRDGGESFTFRTRTAPGKGGDESQYEYARVMQDELGFVYGPYNNYTDFAPVNEYWSSDLIQRSSANQLDTAWPRCYAPKPSRAVEYCARLAPIIEGKFHFSTAYCDVHTAVGPWDRVDYDPRVPGAGTFAATFYSYGEIMLHQKKVLDGPVYSEGNYHALYCGLADGNYGQDYEYEPSVNPWLVDFDLRKMHDLCCNFGMGNTGMFFGRDKSLGSTPQEVDDAIDRFLAATIAFGHPGFLTYDGGGLRTALRSYYMLQQLGSEYCPSSVEDIRYANADGELLETSDALASGAYRRSQVASRYSNGCVTVANGSPKDRMRVNAFGRAIDLPPNGYAGWTDDGSVEVYSGDRTGSRSDYCASPAYIFVDGRGTFSRHEKAAGDGIAICRSLDAGGHEVIPFQGAKGGFAIGNATAVALGRDRAELGEAEVRVARGLTYVMPVDGAFSYVTTPADAPTVELTSDRADVVAGETVIVTGKRKHRVRVPRDAQPGHRLWYRFEGAWIDFAVMPVADAQLAIDGTELVVSLRSHLEGRRDATVALDDRRVDAVLDAETVTEARIDLGPPEREDLEVISVEITSGQARQTVRRAMLTSHAFNRYAVIASGFQMGVGLRGKEESPDAGDTRAYISAGRPSCGDEAKDGWMGHPPYFGAVGYSYALYDPVTVPDAECVFRAAVGKQDGSDPGDGMLYKVRVLDADGTETSIGSQLVAKHHWLTLEGDLTPWRGEEVRIKMIVDVGDDDNSAGDWACWADMRIETPTSPLTRTLDRDVERYRRDPGPYPVEGLTVADLRSAVGGFLRYDGCGLAGGAGEYGSDAVVNGADIGSMAPAGGNEREGIWVQGVGVPLTPEAIATLGRRNCFAVSNHGRDFFKVRRFWLELELADGRRCSSDISAGVFTQPPSWPYAEGVGVPHGEDVTTDIWFDASER